MPKQRKRSGGYTVRQRQVANRKKIFWTVIILALIVAGIVIARHFSRQKDVETVEGADGRPAMEVDLLTVNEYSRPGIALDQVNGIVIHYTANPGSSAKSNRDYFENLQSSHTTKASSHFIVGLDGEIVQCIPTAEIAYASNDRNSDTIAIECCHPDETGKFGDATYSSVINLTAWLCKKFGIGADQVIRHYDVTGKDCPKYYVENPEAWDQFKADVAAKLEEL